jgi:phage terminase large subunit
LQRTVKGSKAGRETAKVLLHGSERYICHEGGARSGKTYGVIQVLIWYAIQFPGKKITVVSHSLPHLKRGALRDFLEIMHNWEWYDEKEHNMSDNVYHFHNGSYIEFFGLEDPGKARGPGRNILFVNEANLVSKLVFDQLDMRTTGKVIIDLNPADFDSWCYTLADGESALKVHSTYLDNPFLEGPQIRVIESYKDADPLMWEVFGLGLRGTSQEQIYTHWKLVNDIPEGEVFYGLDFGFRNPTALVRITLADGAVYVKELIYSSNLTNTDVAERIRDCGVGMDEIFADSAEPRTIEEFYRQGFNIKPADKDVWAGIMKVKSMPLFVHQDSKNLIAELKNYKWKTDKDGNVVDKEPVKLNDHLLDALRYGVFTKLKQPTLTWGVA